VLDFGKVIAQGPPAAIQANPDVIRAYLGEDLSSSTTGAEVRADPNG
jgi:branched-chain amino acid transport system ATP-binding protein